MTMTEKSILEMLSKSEITVYEYIKKQSELLKGSLRESMATIGENISLSEATVHRAIRKLRKEGVIGIVSSMEKAEPNEIVYFGIPDPDKQVGDIFTMIQELSSSAKRFETILLAKDRQIEQLKRDKELLYEHIDRLELELKKSRPFEPSQLISTQPLDDGTTAYIVRNPEH
jgi:DNA-binding PadR family transcriptional regulator